MSKRRFTFLLLSRSGLFLGLVIASLHGDGLRGLVAAPASPFELRESERVVLLGDTLIEREQIYAYVEQRLTIEFPERPVLIRNLGWSGDTPAALSRASFDFEKPEKGFERLREQLLALQPTLVVLGYGMANSFAGEPGLAQFKSELNHLMDVAIAASTNGPVRFLVLSPVPHEDLGRPLPDSKAHNRQLELYTAALRQIAAERKCEFVSLYDLLKARERRAGSTPLTDNGIHLTGLGYAKAAEALAQGLGWQPNVWQAVISANNSKTLGTALSRVSGTQNGVAFEMLDERLVSPALLGETHARTGCRLQIEGLRPGFYELKVDGKAVASGMAEDWKRGVILARGPQFEQAEELRRAILKKNELYFNRWRPQNETYLFGFRKHEQGQNAKEIPMFDPLIGEQETEIDRLRKPVKHVFELTFVRQEKPRFAPIDISRSPSGDPAAAVGSPPLSPRPEFEVAPGFEVNLFAESPLLAKPIQMNFDPQGRLWVASSAVYPQIQPGQVADDKILVLEDTNGDGFAEKSTVFADGLLIPSAVIPGDGGAYVGQSTELLHFKDTNGDGKADEKRVVLSGFGTEDTHHMVHTLRWGPDGRLYFNQSIYIHSHFETPHGVVRLNSGGVWQLRPPTMELSVFLRGFCNPWGHDFDEFGQSFVTDGAGFQGLSFGVPGATYFTYASMRREMQSISAGNYPKFCALEIVRSSQFPDDWQGDAITCDFRAHRVVRFSIEEQGAGYVARQRSDLLLTTNVTFRPIDVKLGPDGALYIADWSNPIIQHGEVDFRDPRRDHEHGRIWRVRAKGRPLVQTPKLVSMPNGPLFEQLVSGNAYNQQQARRVLTERGLSIRGDLAKWTKSQAGEEGLLQALWMYQAIDIVEPSLLKRLLAAKDGRIRAAATRVLSDWHKRLKNSLDLLTQRVADEHPRVRLEAMRGLAQISDARSADLVLSALDKPMDPFLDYAAWLSINDLAEPWLAAVRAGKWKYEGREKQLEFGLKAVEPARAGQVLAQVLRTREIPKDGNGPWIELIASAGDRVLLRRLFEQAMRGGFDAPATARALEGLGNAARQRDAKPDATLVELSPLMGAEDEQVREKALRLAGAWKIRASVPQLLATAGDSGQSGSTRKAAFEALREIGGRQVVDGILPLSSKDHDAGTRRQAVLALAAINLDKASEPAVELLLETSGENEAADFWRSLLGIKGASARIARALPKTGLPPAMAKAGLRVAREGGRNEPDLVWALIRGGDLDTEEQALSPAEIQKLVSSVGSQGDPARGEKIFRRQELACFTCHAIGGSGGKVGPDLTSIGASAPVDYLIESVLYPNRKIKEGYHSIIIETKDGLEFSGVLVNENSDRLVLRDATDKETTVSKNDIEKRSTGNSIMPSGLMDALSSAERLDLFRFLSELGKPGRYDASKPNIARSWKLFAQTLEVSQFGDEKVLETDRADARWKPARSFVDGRLTRQDLAASLEGLERRDPQGIYAATRFEVSKAGAVRLDLTAPEGAPVWIDGKQVSHNTDLTPDLSAGKHTLILKLDAKKLPDAIRLRSEEAVFVAE